MSSPHPPKTIFLRRDILLIRYKYKMSSGNQAKRARVALIQSSLSGLASCCKQDGKTTEEYSCMHCQRTLTGLNATRLKNHLLNPGRSHARTRTRARTRTHAHAHAHAHAHTHTHTRAHTRARTHTRTHATRTHAHVRAHAHAHAHARTGTHTHTRTHKHTHTHTHTHTRAASKGTESC